MRESYADSSFQPSLAERLEFIAQRLEGVAWVGLFAGACFAGFLIISI
jgi:hypothetical protein